ncbi:MBL fold metallo-hydrolase [Spirulina sp. 06S082]|uniref:MBL fold metallo-hydrolase n=1 Tax=Spirulina sp. 06S082 TaxID=3110248 RepID=UPI002B204FC6|nr:MBL fold metallo-hydrolase [Spirulina sp. 06S082]MEA5471908.1 MBL fold metallo-hydrolase [Spirulina sp. 06S082]
MNLLPCQFSRQLFQKCAIALVNLGAIFITASPLLAQDFENAEIKTIPVDDGIYMLRGVGGNLGLLVGEDGIFLIDDEYAPLSEKVMAAIAAISDRPIRFVINTHWHSDHTGGNENLGRAGTIIVAHDNVRERMSTEQFLEILDRTLPASPPAALPTITFNDTVTFYLNDNEISALHVDFAHTDGDSIIHIRDANIIHTGDIYFNGAYPFIDVDSEGSINGVLAAVEKLLQIVDDRTKIIPGHGPLSNRSELISYRNMLLAVRDRVTTAILAGMSVEEFLASDPTADFDPTWGNGFLKPEQFLRIVYADLSRSRQ